MKIGVDISMLVYQGSGVAAYTFQMVSNLLKLDKKNEYVLFYSSLRTPKDFQSLDELKKLGAKIYHYRFPTGFLKFIWNKFHILPIEWLIGRVDFFFSSDFLRQPLFKGTKGITTIHDLTWKLFPEFHTNEIIVGHEKKIKKTIQYQDIIITDSNNTKNDLLKLYPQTKNNNQVYVIYPGIDTRFKKISKNDIKRTLSKYNISYPLDYLLYVGAIEPRKQLDVAIKTFSKLIKNSKYQHFKFYIAGRAGWKNKNIFKLVKSLKLDNKVIFLGYVLDKDLPALYSGATVNIYMSRYEGFGLPPLEAAACGTPTLLYANSSLKELFSESYLFTKVGEELKTLINLIESKNVLNSENIAKFSWNNFVSMFISVLESNYENKKRPTI